MKIRAANGRSAFTLIEILLAMAIFGMALAAIYATWSAILRATKSGQEVAAQVQRERVAIRTIEETLSSARSFAADIQRYGFVAESGAEAKLSFVTRLAPDFPRSGRFWDFDVRRVEFSLAPGKEGGKELVLRQAPILKDFDEDEMNYPLVLARNVKAFTVECWDTQLGDWTDSYTQTNVLPKLVKVTLTMEPPTGSHQAAEEITRIVALPSITVPQTVQVPRLPGGGQPSGGSGTGGGGKKN